MYEVTAFRENTSLPPHAYVTRTGALAAVLLCCTTGAVLPAHSALASPPADMRGEARWTDLGGGVLKDESTGLQWTRDDNGHDINWIEANSLCAGKGKGWRLPSADELTAIYDLSQSGTMCAQALCKVPSKFNLTGTWFWSATQKAKDATDGDELAWGVLLVNGARTPSVRESAYRSRALCTRRP
jgi:hypothetical protein